MSEPTVGSGDEKLARVIGLPQLVALTVNTVIGAGIFALPAIAAQTVGAAAPIAFAVCAGLMLMIVTAFALAGSRVSATGGIYAYAEVAFGPFAGFLTGVVQWLASLLAVAAVASTLLDQVAAMAPVFAPPPVRAALIVTVLGVLALLNMRSTRAGTRLIEAVTVVKLVPVLLFVAAGLAVAGPDVLHAPSLPSASGLGRAVLLLIFPFSGVELAVTPGGEIRNPARTLPRAILLSLAAISVLYIVIQLLAEALLGSGLAAQPAPLAAAAAQIAGESGRSFMLLAVVISTAGYLTCDMLSTPRILFAFGRDGFLPRAFAYVHPNRRTPVVAIAVHAILVATLAATNGFARLLILASIATLVQYLACCLAAWQLRRRDVRMMGEPFAVPGGGIIPLAGAAVIVAVLTQTTRAEWITLGSVVATATVIYGVRGIVRRRVQPAVAGAV
jgi:basic amino acid/polyamine antiporter, APA family